MSYFDDHEDEIIYGRPWRYGQEPESAECKHCGENGLKWHQTKQGWRLFDSVGKEHSCNVERIHRAVADDFEDCT